MRPHHFGNCFVARMLNQLDKAAGNVFFAARINLGAS
jgi:hypothetical protein